jgi:hypothetical protein
MRQIKFRAWNANEKRMTAPAFWVNECNLMSSYLGSAPTHPLMQYTGLKDASGVEIYEGDIVEDCEHFYSVILWSEDHCMHIASDVGGLCDMAFPVKVIGNIYENPELLEPSQ